MLPVESDIDFFFDISKQIKEFYETAIIFLTKKDYSDAIFNALCGVRTTLRNADKNKLFDIIVDFHLQWLHSVNDIEQFKKHIDDYPREILYEAISFTIDAMSHRYKYYQRYVENNQTILPNIKRVNLLADLEIIEEMHKEVTQTLLDNLKAFRNFQCDAEFQVHLKEQIDELLIWLDKIYDGLAMKLSKYINFNVPHHTDDLTKTLQQIVDEIHSSDETNLDAFKGKAKVCGSMILGTADHSLEISKVYEKINLINERLTRLRAGQEAASVLTNKKLFLENRIASLESLKINLKQLKFASAQAKQVFDSEETCVCEDFFQMKIFNHRLAVDDRERLVTELCYLWDLAVFGNKNQSIISILSAAEMKEEYADEMGTFYIDEHSRRIYKKTNDEVLYQPNDLHELVPLSDDADHIYFYDECGRYYIDPKTRERVYKAHATASEFMIDSTGVLIKVKEVRDGIEYFYDNYGRYYINAEGKHIYREEDSTSEYENDGLGNLVRIRSHLDIFDPCPDDVHVTEDFKYLKQVVGPALRVCIAEVILHQPSDPIYYLCTRLIKYRENIEMRDKRARDKEELDAEREFVAAEEQRAAAERAAMEASILLNGASEASYDSNLIKYRSMPDSDTISLSEKRNILD